jgi:transcriptional regulator GlxA family with amidase domain
METVHPSNTVSFAGALGALIGIGIASLALTGCEFGGSLPPLTEDAAVRARQASSFVEGLKPRRPGRPVVAVLALNEGTEITDFLLPHAVLQRAGIADVQAVAPRRGRVSLYPALQVEVGQDLAGFDRDHPAGADYVIVPAVRDDDDPALLAWLRRQADQGARIIGICSGALVLGRAGLLDGRRFASHWYYRRTLLERHPGATFVPHQRYVVDRDVATSTGISASIPITLALVEAIGGREKARALAAELGVASWDPTHDSTPFRLDVPRALSYALNKIAFWRRERWSVGVHDGMDDVALALSADAWSRTGRVRVEAHSASSPVTLRSGLKIAAEPSAVEPTLHLPLDESLKPVQQLDRTLCEIGERYGASRREWVMMEMEYSGLVGACDSNQAITSAR